MMTTRLTTTESNNGPVGSVPLLFVQAVVLVVIAKYEDHMLKSSRSVRSPTAIRERRSVAEVYYCLGPQYF